MEHFDVIIIGGGHAGVEAAAAAARTGVQTALVTHRFDRLGEMSCNPAMGGLGKGHLIREIDALDGVMGRISDIGAIQYRLLNRSKGPAVQGPRSQIDRALYRDAMQAEIAKTENLTVIEGEATKFKISDNRIVSVYVGDRAISADAFVLTTGTFLGGTIHIGEETVAAGRVGDPASVDLASQLRGLGLPMGRLKTGTPPRLISSTINWAGLGTQPADEDPVHFSTITIKTHQTQIECGITETNEATHKIIRDNIDRSAMYSGNISGTGPRYCPSIEDKVSRFADKLSHQVFLEPEGLDSDLIYPNGISTSLPRDVQLAYVRSMRGLENVEIEQYGYAIEYDYIDPRALDASLALRMIPNLYFAGQINGTTGYEEAGAQGLVAGLNASRASRGLEAAEFSRTNSYIGVMIDDLITRGVSEPYRMFTSRAEYRLSIRADNADQRLTPSGIEWGLVKSERAALFSSKIIALDRLTSYAMKTKITSNTAVGMGFDVKADGKNRSLYELLSYPDITADKLARHDPTLAEADSAILRQMEIEAIYATYIERQARDIEQFDRDRNLSIPPNFTYQGVPGLSNELIQKFERNRPANLAEANQIEGMTPAALTLIAAHLRKARAS